MHLCLQVFNGLALFESRNCIVLRILQIKLLKIKGLAVMLSFRQSR